MNDNEELDRATGEQTVEKLEFRLGPLGAAVPLLFFVVWAITISVLQLSSEVALVLGSVMGVTLGLLLCKSKWEDYAQGLFDGLAQPIGVIAMVAWFYAGMFAQILQVGGLVEGLVWIGSVTGVEGGLFVALTFLLAAVFSTAVGTGYGTTVAFCTLMYPAGVAVGGDPTFMFAAILAGAVFGDNLAPVSDTTIVSATTQEADVPGVVRSRFKYSIAAALPAVILFAVFGGGGTATEQASAGSIMETVGPSGLIMLVPFAIVLILALSGQHLLTSLTWGILSAIVLILLVAPGTLGDIIRFDPDSDNVVQGALVSGLTGYFNMAILILLIVGSAHLMRLGGTMAAITEGLVKWIRNSVRRAELSIWAIVALLNSSITINTAAEIAAAPFVKEIGEKYQIHRYRRANMLDAVTSALGYIFPWGAPVLLGWSTIQTIKADSYDWLPVVEPTAVFPFVFQGWFLFIIMLIAALTGWGLRYEGKNGEELMERPDENES
ncbi:Na+/H+ antiporter NhaC family protein [Salinicoccus carnicancri]|uniref:Na+/H+ antiporter NhaC family protein n=1 Tax=Salinicoccus carnicancri TaxID=558170 RepID=UPI00047787CD|nr:Na+/H+ antiporter NhaC family protein [Salinicoccus carnicancri]